MKTFFSILLFALISALSISCGTNDPAPAPEKVVNVQYRVTVSDEYKAVAAFTSANYTIISQDQIKGSWTSDVFHVDRSQVTISANSVPDNQYNDTTIEGNLLVEILIDGTVAKEARARGKTISLTVGLGN